MFTKKKTKTQRIVEEARDIASQISSWLEDRMDAVPDRDEVKENVSEAAREALDAARARMEEVADWLTELAEEVSDRLAERISEPLLVEVEDERGKGKVFAAAVGAGVAAWYFFEPQQGPQRRRRLVEWAKSTWGRLTESFAAV